VLEFRDIRRQLKRNVIASLIVNNSPDQNTDWSFDKSFSLPLAIYGMHDFRSKMHRRPARRTASKTSRFTIVLRARPRCR
jgi:hypothetical protein